MKDFVQSSLSKVGCLTTRLFFAFVSTDNADNLQSMMQHSINHIPFRMSLYIVKKKVIYQYSSKEHVKIRKTAMFGCKILQYTENIAL